MITTLALPAIVPALVVLVNFMYFVADGEMKVEGSKRKILELWTMIFLPGVFLFSELSATNDCCSSFTAFFSPDHKIGIYSLIITCLFFYLILIYREKILPPILEFLVNLFLLLGLIINVILIYQFSTYELTGLLLGLVGNIPIVLLILVRLAENQRMLKTNLEKKNAEEYGPVNKVFYAIIMSNPVYKYPFLLVLLAPLIMVFSLILTLFGQQPDHLIKTFTQTYYLGFSELSSQCDNVICGGHFLCSVGANGHKNIVKPIRIGERNGHKIICNRQLLISNAFEELLQESLPGIHHLLRKNYNKIGRRIHQHYHFFNIKLISDFTYILMKPLEWLFVIILYIFDRQPENRIERQYIGDEN